MGLLRQAQDRLGRVVVAGAAIRDKGRRRVAAVEPEEALVARLRRHKP